MRPGHLLVGLAGVALAAEAETVSGVASTRVSPAQAQVRILAASGPDGGWRPCASDVRGFRENLSRGPTVLAEVETDASGAFDLSYEPQPGSTVELTSPGFRPKAFDARLMAEWNLRPPRRMSYLVDEPLTTHALRLCPADAGTPVSGARLTWRRGETGPVMTATSDARGRVAVETEVCFLAEAPGFEPVVSSSGKELRLERAKRVEARVLLDGGLTDAQIEVESARGKETLATDGGVLQLDEWRAPYTLRARAPGRLAIAHVTDTSPERIELDLRPSARLTFSATLERLDEVTVSVGDQQVTLRGWPDRPRAQRAELEVFQGTWRLRSWRHAMGEQTPSYALEEWLDVDGDREQTLDLFQVPITGAVVSSAGTPMPARVRVESDLEFKCGMGMGICTALQTFADEASTLDGGFRLYVPEAGEYRVSAWGLDAGGVAQTTVTLPSKPLRLVLAPGEREPRRTSPRHFITGTVRDEQGRPADRSVCAILGNGGDCQDSHDGGFSVEVYVPGVPYRMSVHDQGERWYSDPVLARPGDHVELVARKWKPRKVRVTDRAGKPVRTLPRWMGGPMVSFDWARREELSPEGYVPLAFDTETVGAALQLEPLPLRGTVRDAAGRPAEGAAVALLCDSVVNERPVRWSRYTSDVGPTTSWTFWPGGVQCLSGVASADAAGRFEFRELQRPFSMVEVRHGKRRFRFPWVYGQPLDLVLP